jgi:hydroxyacylglutathione hydrolase
MEQPSLKVLTIVSAIFDENTYIAYFEGRSDALVVDPGLEPEKIIASLEELGLAPAVILCTHGHSDHIAGNEELKGRWPDAPLVIGTGDAAKLTDPEGNLSAGYGFSLISPEADRTVSHGELLEYAGFQLEVRDTPGHSPGHVVFVAKNLSPIQVFGGDVLFSGSIGRTDFPDGSFDELKQAIDSQLFTLPDDTLILPGHGPPTTIGKEKNSNPFVGLNA